MEIYEFKHSSARWRPGNVAAVGIRELNQIAKKYIKNAEGGDNYLAFTRNEKSRLAWLDKHQSPGWGDNAAKAAYCRGLAWAIRAARKGERVLLATEEDGYYFAFAKEKKRGDTVAGPGPVPVSPRNRNAVTRS